MKRFRATIYKVGINPCVDVPERITKTMTPEKGYIRVVGKINGGDFTQTLVPVKNKPYRLYVNFLMLKAGTTSLGEEATFQIEQNLKKKVVKKYPIHPALLILLKEHKLEDAFAALTTARRHDILKYLFANKTEATLTRNVDKVIKQLLEKKKDVRIP